MTFLSERWWCGREDSNFHGCYPTATSTLRVYQFRHDRTSEALVTRYLAERFAHVKSNFGGFSSRARRPRGRRAPARQSPGTSVGNNPPVFEDRPAETVPDAS